MSDEASLHSEIMQTMSALKAHREAGPDLLAAKRRVLRAVVDAGVSKRRVPEYVTGVLQAGGWTPEEIAQVGLSGAQVTNDLNRVAE